MSAGSDGLTNKSSVALLSTNVDSILTDMPIPVKHTDFPSNAASIFAIARSAGQDVRFYSDSGGTVELAVDIEQFGSSTFIIWVKVPSLSSSVTTTIWMFYGNPSLDLPAANSTYGSQNVWTSYLSRYAMNEVSGPLTDSAVAANNWAENGTLPNQVSGQFDSGQDFNGSSDYFAAPNRMVGTADLSISFWIKTTQIADSGAHWFDGNGIVETDIVGEFEEWGISLIDGATSVIAFGMGDSLGNDVTLKGTVQINDGNWHYVTCTWNIVTGVRVIYVDGSLDSTDIGAIGARENETPTIGRVTSTGKYFDGVLDQFTFRSGAITSASRHKAGYQFGFIPGSNIVGGPTVPAATLAELLECCQANGLLSQAILVKLSLRGFRNDKPTRKDLETKMDSITVELSTIKRILQNITSGGR